MAVQLWKVSYNDVTLLLSNTQFSTSDRKLNPKYGGGISDIKYDSYTGCNIGHLKADYTMFKMNAKSLKKFEAMLRQNSLKLKARNYEGTSFQAGVNPDERKNWKKLLKEYRTLLKEF